MGTVKNDELEYSNKLKSKGTQNLVIYPTFKDRLYKRGMKCHRTLEYLCSVTRFIENK